VLVKVEKPGQERRADRPVIGPQTVVLAAESGLRGIAAQAAVFGNIPAGGTWSGYPARPHRQALRASAALFKLAGMMRRLEKLLGEPESR